MKELEGLTDLKKSVFHIFKMGELNKPVIEIFSFPEVDIRVGVADFSTFVFVIDGECNISYHNQPGTVAKKNEFIFVPKGFAFETRIPANSYIVVIRLALPDSFLGRHDLNLLYEEAQKEIIPDTYKLPIRDILSRYLQGVISYLENGISSKTFYEIKIQELFLIFDTYYTRRELGLLLKPVLSRDIHFANFVFANWTKAKSARELAGLSAYCESAFNRKFKEVFGETPYRWLNRKKANQIEAELRYRDKPFKVIAEEFGFNTLQQFNSYCKCHFKKTPGEIRKEVGRKR